MTNGPSFIRINFARGDYRLLSKVFWGLVLGSITLLFTLVIMVRGTVSSRASADALHLRIERLSLRDDALRPVLQEREQFLKDVSAMSGLIETRKFSWVRLFTSVEAAFPTGVALERAALSPRDSALSLQGKASSPEALRNLMVGLEKSSSFKDTLLTHQSVEKGIISFTLVTTYHDAKGVGLVQAK